MQTVNHTPGTRCGSVCIRHASRRSLHVCAAIKERSQKHVLCSKTLVAKPEQADSVAKLCSEVVAVSQQKVKDKQHGIIAYDCHRDNWETNIFHFMEKYESNVFMGRHNTSPEVSKFMEEVQPHLEGPMGMVLYEMKNGKLGMSSVQGGPKGEGGMDDATGASGAAGGASMKQSSATVDLTNLGHEEEDDEEDLTKQVGKQVEKMRNAFTNVFKRS